jgi:MinD-like ATPase involved in chromosome partitioning or flagellar assembly/Fe-S cluster biosynthesis and repair protein YggX
VVFQYDENNFIPTSEPLPLFKSSLFHTSGALNIPIPPLPVPVIAFHSYKGGVGRTLSLFSLARELTLNTIKHKTLIIDADIEAPGLTLMAEGFPAERRISYLDILAIIHDSEKNMLFNEIMSNIVKYMVTSTIKIPAIDITEEHYFLPAYRINYQLLDNFVHPEYIVSMPERIFIISEFLSELGKQLKVDAVIVDLRAGLSELSAPILFDPRVRRVFVTSTSQQSTEGTKLILNEIFKSPFSQKLLFQKMPEQQEIVPPTILLTMVPHRFDEEKLRAIKQNLIQEIPEELYKTEDSESDDEVMSDVIIHSEHSSELIHLEDLQQVCDALRGTSTARASELLVKRIIPVQNLPQELNTNTFAEYRDEIIKKIYNLVSKEVTAEGTFSVNIMATEALENLVKNYEDRLPRVVILGAKGSGKTYIYKQLVEMMYWERFTSKILSKPEPESKNILIVPVLATTHRMQFIQLFDSCFATINEALGTIATSDVLNKNDTLLKEHNDNETIKQGEWDAIWDSILINSLPLPQDNNYKNLAELDSKLSALGKKIVFVIDGLEDIFIQSISSESSKIALKVLCQDFMNHIVNYKNIGVLIFIRSDMAQSVIQTNYQQFFDQYSSFMLKWSQDEALRLVIWVLAQVQFNGYHKEKTKIPKLTHDALPVYLNPFWGLKLGGASSNEAGASRWILAALSDLNRQLQARDIIRFLQYATSETSKNIYYNDRILQPIDIRKAIDPCSKAKLGDVTAEMKNLEPIFKKLENIPQENKMLPLPLDTAILNSDEREQLEAQGFLRSTKDGYYLPEIIRHALGYKYTRGARPKVLSLLIDSKT